MSRIARLSYLGVRRVALVSDTHGAVVEPVLEAIADADLVVHAGDVGGAAVLERLSALAPVVAVAGNNDIASKWPADEQDTLRGLPEVALVALPGGTLVAVHGHQWPRVARRHAGLRAGYPEARCIVYGHSHRRLMDVDAAPWVVNPGAAGRSRALGGAGWLGLTSTRSGWRIGEGCFG